MTGETFTGRCRRMLTEQPNQQEFTLSRAGLETLVLDSERYAASNKANAELLVRARKIIDPNELDDPIKFARALAYQFFDAVKLLTHETHDNVGFAHWLAMKGYFAQPQSEKVATPQAEMAPFQQRVQPWMMECFGSEISADKLERNDRFIEEALELAQATGYSAERAHALVDYVFGRDIGEPSQEVGGVMVTLAALCLAHGLDMHGAGETELARINQPEIVQKIRVKQAAKPTGSALPIATPPQPEGGMVERAIRALKKIQPVACGDWCRPGEHIPECQEAQDVLAALQPEKTNDQ